MKIGDLAKFHCFDGSIEVKITEINDNIVCGKSEFGYHWSNPKDVELMPDSNDC